VLLPASAMAQQHGVTIAKSCTQARNRCATNTDCVQPTDICAGASSCSTTAQNQANIADCLITITDADGFFDSIMINQATDTETNGTGLPNTSSNILVSATTGTVTGTGCPVGQDVSPVNTCTLHFSGTCPGVSCTGASITFESKFYVVQAADPSPLLDRADVALQDVCDGAGSNCAGGNGCNCGGVTVSFGASTTLVSGCSTPVALADSTACTDNDNNVCTTAGCEAGACVQNHIPTVCTPSTNECLTNPACDPVAGCTHPPKADSTLCTDNDNNVCTTAGCEAGACVQTHAVMTCTPSTNECLTNPACDPVAGCTHPPVADSTPCTDSDGVACTTAGCEAGSCVQTHVDTCQANEICRTPGFWGTHACPGGTQTSLGVCEKAGSTNITQIVLDQNPGLTICGHPITTTDLTNTSAVEAICVAIKGDSTLQVARQLTAAALNCIVSNSTGCGTGQNATDPCSGISIDAVFTACNATANGCAVTATLTDGTVVNCIEALDCFNNGGSFDPATGTCSASLNSCHDRLLVNGCFNFEPPGPAGSPKECNDARKDSCTIFCGVPCSNTVACP
jgi:hypothetical protein